MPLSRCVQCRAVAAAAFGDADRTELVITTTAEKFPLLLDGTIDLQARTTTHTMERDVFEVRLAVEVQQKSDNAH